jgi:hypothetical protein
MFKTILTTTLIAVSLFGSLNTSATTIETTKEKATIAISDSTTTRLTTKPNSIVKFYLGQSKEKEIWTKNCYQLLAVRKGSEFDKGYKIKSGAKIDPNTTYALVYDQGDLAVKNNRFTPDYKYKNGRPMNDVIWVQSQNIRNPNKIKGNNQKCTKTIQRSQQHATKITQEVIATIKYSSETVIS